MLPYFLNSSLPEAEFNRIIKELHKDSLGQPDLRTSRAGKDVTKYPVPECMCNDSRTHSYLWVNSGMACLIDKLKLLRKSLEFEPAGKVSTGQWWFFGWPVFKSNSITLNLWVCSHFFFHTPSFVGTFKWGRQMDAYKMIQYMVLWKEKLCEVSLSPGFALGLS